MPNRSKEENIRLLSNALYHAGEAGLSIDEAEIALFGEDSNNKSAVKKLLEHMRAAGMAKVKVSPQHGKVYVSTEIS